MSHNSAGLLNALVISTGVCVCVCVCVCVFGSKAFLVDSPNPPYFFFSSAIKRCGDWCRGELPYRGTCR